MKVVALFFFFWVAVRLAVSLLDCSLTDGEGSDGYHETLRSRVKDVKRLLLSG